jgi:hypothetical protein
LRGRIVVANRQHSRYCMWVVRGWTIFPHRLNVYKLRRPHVLERERCIRVHVMRHFGGDTWYRELVRRTVSVQGWVHEINWFAAAAAGL